MGLALTSAAPAADAEPDPEPEPQKRHSAKAGGLYVRADRDGVLTATDAAQKEVWRYRPKAGRGRPHLIGGDRLLVMYDDGLGAIDPATGRWAWEVGLTDLTDQKWHMMLKGGLVTISTRGRYEVIDARTGIVRKVVNSRR